MANHPKKMKDPTEVALSAIQEALNVRDSDKAPMAPPVEAIAAAAPPAEGRRRNTRTPPSLDDELFMDAPGKTANEDAQSARLAANDDRQSIGNVLHAIQRKPSRTPFLAAAGFSFAWVVCAI